jgi:hypothetical protein
MSCVKDLDKAYQHVLVCAVEKGEHGRRRFLQCLVGQRFKD